MLPSSVNSLLLPLRKFHDSVLFFVSLKTLVLSSFSCHCTSPPLFLFSFPFLSPPLSPLLFSFYMFGGGVNTIHIHGFHYHLHFGKSQVYSPELQICKYGYLWIPLLGYPKTTSYLACSKLNSSPYSTSNPDLFSPNLSEKYYYTHLILQVRDLGAMHDSSLSLDHIIPKFQWLLPP